MSMSRRHRFEIVCLFALLFIADWFLYFRHAGHFFQGDSVFLLTDRASSASAYLEEFVTRGPSGWYRPLAFELVPSLFYPIVGLHPIAYRIPVYLFFFLDTIAVFALAHAITRRRLIAAIAATFFSIHTINAYTTFDIGFLGELLYTFFYIGSALAYVKYLREDSKWAYRLSLVCFVMSLLSKETAVTLPAVLFALHILVRGEFLRAFRSTFAHSLILVAYLLFAFGYLNVMGVTLTTIPTAPAESAGGGYYAHFDRAVLKNADVAMSWAFNLPRGGWSQWREVTPTMLTFLKSFRLVVVLLMVVLMFRPERKWVLFGAVWFFTALLPALPLRDHFIPHYLFLSLVGFSIAVGAALAWMYDALRQLHPAIPAVAMFLIFGTIVFVSSHSVSADIRKNRLLGGSAELAFNSVTDLKRLYPTAPSGTRFFFDDASEPLNWDHGRGGLIKMAYGTDDISVLYASEGDALDFDAIDKSIVLDVVDKHLVDKTGEYRRNPASFIAYMEPGIYELDLSATEVVAGRDKYSVKVSGARDVVVRFTYRLNDRPPEGFSARLDADGRASFDVSAETLKGTYHFIAFHIAGQREWVRLDKTIVVR
jgi:hypothetical protein